MNPLIPEQRNYKQKTINQLLVNESLLEDKLAQERRLDVAESMRKQLEEIQTHLKLLQQELAANTVVEPVADKLFVRAARALSNDKFYLGRKRITTLETIEPFYPGLEKLRYEADTEQVSRRTRSIAQGNLPVDEQAYLQDQAAAVEYDDYQSEDMPVDALQTVPQPQEYYEYDLPPRPPRKRGLARLFQFHVVASCLVVFFVLMVMLGVGGVTILQFLLEGN
ncbi:MAG: hypothetical protein AAF485_28235 [Chloroflexota bacterium]